MRSDKDPEKELSSNLLEAIQRFALELTREPLDEIRGIVTGQAVRKWIAEKRIDTDANAAVFLYSRKREFLTVALLNLSNEIVDLSNGKKALIGYKCREMDEDLKRLIGANECIILKL